MNVQERIAKAKADLADAKPITIQVEVGGEATELSFRPISGTDWANLTAVNPPRKGATLDGNIGYNLDAVAKAFPPSHVLIDGEPSTVQKVTEDGETITVNIYADLVSALASPHIKRIGEVLFHIQQMVPAQRLIELGKASAGVQKKKPRSPAK